MIFILKTLLQIYIPTTKKKQLQKEIQEQTITLYQNSKYRYIIIEDFNSIPNPCIDHSSSKKISIHKTQLIKYLISHQYKDIYHFFSLTPKILHFKIQIFRVE